MPVDIKDFGPAQFVQALRNAETLADEFEFIGSRYKYAGVTTGGECVFLIAMIDHESPKADTYIITRLSINVNVDRKKPTAEWDSMPMLTDLTEEMVGMFFCGANAITSYNR